MTILRNPDRLHTGVTVRPKVEGAPEVTVRRNAAGYWRGGYTTPSGSQRDCCQHPAHPTRVAASRCATRAWTRVRVSKDSSTDAAS